MIVTDTIYHRDLPFEKYLALPGVSYSSLKEKPAGNIPGVSLGTRVHNYLLEPEKYDWKDAGYVRQIAAQLRKVLGDAINVFEKEIAFTAKFHHNGITLNYKGRADLILIGRMIIDLKVLSGSLDAAIDHFGYRDQVSGYCLATGADRGLIIAYNKAKRQVEMKQITPNPAFWQYQCVRLGAPETIAETELATEATGLHSNTTF